MKRLLYIFLLLFFYTSHAQKNTDSLSGHLYKKGLRWRLDGKILDEKGLRTELYKSPISIPYYQKARTSKIIGLSFTAPTVLFILISNQNKGMAGANNNNTGFAIAGIISGGAVVYFLTRSIKYYKKAVQVHNENTRTIY